MNNVQPKALRIATLVAVAMPAWAGSLPAGGVEEDLAWQLDGPIVSGTRQDDNASLAARQKRISANPRGPAAAPPPGGPDSATQGVFGPVVSWPSVPIHMVLTPDGRVLNFGATSTGLQGGDMDYAVWDPKLGTGSDAFELLPNTTEVNIFCAGQWLLPATGKVLITGGTVIRPPVRGIGINDVTLFSPRSNTIASTTSMAYRRWYATTIGTLNGEVVALGGRIDPTEITGGAITAANTPEAYNPKTRVWRELPGAYSEVAYGQSNFSWYYPRAWMAPSGKTFIVAHDGSTYSLSTTGQGSITTLAATVPRANTQMGNAMYAPGKIMMIRDDRKIALIDINGAQPVVTAGTPISRHRRYGNATLLPTGQVFVNGGVASDDNTVDGAHLISETWDPATGLWTQTAAATIPRLYHSTALLLPDATVLTGGGGLPGPLTNMNGEIYYPPYLYKKDGSGQPAPRPTLDTRGRGLGWDQAFSVSFGGAKPIARVVLLRSGQTTHVFNNGQRFQELPFTVSGDKLNLRTPGSRTVAPEGYYLLFAIDSDGVPSTAKLLRIYD